MLLILKFCSTIVLLSTFSEAADCEDSKSKRHFVDLCFSPTKIFNFDFKWSLGAQPADGWHVALTNVITRQHITEIFHGKLLSRQYDFKNPCFRSKLEPGDGIVKLVDGTVYGFGNSSAKWACNASLDTPGVYRCDIISSGPTIFHDGLNIYPIYSDRKNLQVQILCFYNGDVGWWALSISPTLTEQEKIIVSALIRHFGFSDEDTVAAYTENCSKEPSTSK